MTRTQDSGAHWVLGLREQDRGQAGELPRVRVQEVEGRGPDAHHHDGWVV
jgi:hypothetical protein